MITRCPECNRTRLPLEEQPEPGTRARSVKYACGGQIVVVLGQDYWHWEIPCPTSEPTAAEQDDLK